ncbi:hypothetical protein, partial [Kistimonas scapharcae]|uniref:hypothetical protein n=1 Tax=Kistimonas scapharcae TaxID=1036133 RepID=UPI0031E89396
SETGKYYRIRLMLAAMWSAQEFLSTYDTKKIQALASIKNTADLGCRISVLKSAVHHTHSISSSRLSKKSVAGYIALFLAAGLAGALNIFGMSSASPSERQEWMLAFTLLGTALLHGFSFVYQVKSSAEQRLEFKQKPVSDKLVCIAKQSGTVIPSVFGTLPDGALTFFGLVPRVGNFVVPGLCALANVLVETVTYNLLAKDFLYSFIACWRTLCKGISDEYFENVQQVVDII